MTGSRDRWSRTRVEHQSLAVRVQRPDDPGVLLNSDEPDEYGQG